MQSSHFEVDSLLEYHPHYLVHITISAVLALASFLLLHKLCSSILLNGSNLSLAKAASDLQKLIRYSHITFGLLGFALMWIPGCGLIQHGW